ncbi:MAG: RNase adapter RapZ [Clostridia bacterium]|nr:RNase adapter RapZ [Clostridia bacterium]
MELIIITGVSGAGKSSTAHALEDLGYFCMDNVPPKLISGAVRLSRDGAELRKMALVTDIRAGGMLSDLRQELQTLKDHGVQVRVLFLDASDEVLLSRYHLTRRAHPLMESDGVNSIAEALHKERGLLSFVREMADIVIDTTALKASELRRHITQLLQLTAGQTIAVSVMSFGFTHSVPREADLMFDVRCLPNPYYVASLKPLTGKDAAVYDYVFSFAESEGFFAHIYQMLAFALPLYIKEGKTRLVVAVGCSGGQHRSVAFAERLGKALSEDGYAVTVYHRELHQ